MYTKNDIKLMDEGKFPTPDNNINYYTEIDSLFDTRLPLIAAISSTLAKDIVDDTSYLNRIKDEFEYIGSDYFNTLYNNRNKGILKYALPTYIVDTIKDFIDATKNDIVNYSSPGKLLPINAVRKLYINLYPYNLDLKEQSILKQYLEMHFKSIEIEFLYLSNSDLKPEWIYNNITFMVKYDLMEWIELHMVISNLVNKPLFRVKMIGALRVVNEIPTSKVTEDLIKSYSEISKLMGDIELVPMGNFSFNQDYLE